MAATEFELIDRYFNQAGLVFDRAGVVLGPGDDAAILSVSPERQLLVSVDTLNEGVHFPAGAPPHLLAERCLRVNLSDLAAMGGDPVGFTLALSMPDVSESWLQAFSSALAQVAREFNCVLLGGDTTRGAFSVTVQVHGEVPRGQALLRSGARAGDGIYVTGTLGNGAAALSYLQAKSDLHDCDQPDPECEYWLNAFYRPVPRLKESQVLRGLASAAIDISDGLASDLVHIIEASSRACGRALGAALEVSRIPHSDEFQRLAPEEQQLELALSGGDDYELCVCIPPQHERAAEAALAATGTQFTRIGVVDGHAGVRLVDDNGQAEPLTIHGYRHFDAAPPSPGTARAPRGKP